MPFQGTIYLAGCFTICLLLFKSFSQKTRNLKPQIKYFTPTPRSLIFFGECQANHKRFDRLCEPIYVSPVWEDTIFEDQNNRSCSDSALLFFPPITGTLNGWNSVKFNDLCNRPRHWFSEGRPCCCGTKLLGHDHWFKKPSEEGKSSSR